MLMVPAPPGLIELMNEPGRMFDGPAAVARPYTGMFR